MKQATYYWFEGKIPVWLSDFLLSMICWFKGHDPSPGPVAALSVGGKPVNEVYSCWRCYRIIPPPEETK